MMDETPLTAEEVAALPDGKHVVVIWSGGNGPHHYIKTSIDGRPVAASVDDIQYGIVDEVGKSLSAWPNGFVGQEEFHTRVWECGQWFWLNMKRSK